MFAQIAQVDSSLDLLDQRLPADQVLVLNINQPLLKECTPNTVLMSFENSPRKLKTSSLKTDNVTLTVVNIEL